MDCNNTCHGCKWLDEVKSQPAGNGYCSYVVRSSMYKPSHLINGRLEPSSKVRRPEMGRCELYEAAAILQKGMTGGKIMPKKNPNRLPLAKNSFNANEIIREATIGMNFRAWLLVLNSFANFSEATKESILKLWQDVNAYGTTISTYEDIKSELDYINKITGVKVVFDGFSSKNIATQGDLNRFKRRAERNAFSSALAIIAEPIIRNQLLPEDDIGILFKRVLLTNEEIEDRALKISDLQEVLEDEFDLALYRKNDNVCLSKIIRTPVTSEGKISVE